MSDSDPPEVLIYDHDEEPYVIFGLDDGDGSESLYALSPAVADEIADRLKASAREVRRRFPEGVQ